MQFALILGAFLSFCSGLQLFILTDQTADLFAWTIAAGSSATILGAFYWTACTLSFLSWRRQTWARARVGVPGVTLFLWATLFTTLLHLEKFHFSGSASGQVAAWVWLVIYVVDPILLTTALFLQWRMPGVDPPRAAPLTSLYKYALVASGGIFTVLGLVMLFLPQVVIGVSAWPLTPLTSRAIGSWVLALGVVFITMRQENDTDRIRPAAGACLVLPSLLLIGMARYSEQFSWNSAAWAYLILVTLVAGLGLRGLISAPQTTLTRSPSN